MKNQHEFNAACSRFNLEPNQSLFSLWQAARHQALLDQIELFEKVFGKHETLDVAYIIDSIRVSAGLEPDNTRFYPREVPAQWAQVALEKAKWVMGQIEQDTLGISGMSRYLCQLQLALVEAMQFGAGTAKVNHERWEFMMRVADDDQEAVALMCDMVPDENDTRPESVQLAEVVDKCIAKMKESSDV